MDQAAGSLERPEDIEKDAKGVVRRWLLELKLADKREDKWRKKADTVWKRYRQKDPKRHSFNILWSNTETLMPAVYNSLPKPDVRRRFKDADPMGKAVSEVLSRSLEYGLDTTDFDTNIKSSVLDMLLPGRGVARVRYVPSLKQVTADTPTDSAESHTDGGEAMEGADEELAWEQAPIEHVQWDDFRILCAAKEWGDVTAIGFKHNMTRDALEEKFGDVGEKVKLDATDDVDVNAEKDPELQETFKTAEVWEIWDKDEREVLFISAGYKEGPLKTLPDPLTLTDFWPVPRPLYAIEDSSQMVPGILYEMYKEQADELDTVTARINKLIKGLKMRGIYDSTLTELSELMRGEDNDLIPAVQVSAFMERGGLEKAIWFMPIEQAAKVLKELYVQREQVKQVIYEITGLGDILRGVSDPNETARAQEIKAKWGGSRISKMQQEVARFIRDLMRLQSEIIGERFQPETLETMTGLKLPMLAEKQQAQAQYQQQQAMAAQQQGQQPPEVPEILQKPAWEEIIQVLRDDKLRTFKVDVETDSTVAASMEGDMQGLQQILGGISELINGLGPAVQQGAVPVDAVKELIMVICRRAKMGNAVEDAFDKMQAPKPQTDPKAAAEQAKVQQAQQQQAHDQQIAQRQQEHEEQVAQRQQQFEQQKAAQEQAMEERRLQMEAHFETQRIQAEAAAQQQQAMMDAAFERFKALLEAKTKIEVAEISAGATLDAAQIGAAKDGTE